MRNGKPPLNRQILGVIALFALFGTACAELDRPESFSPSTSTTVASADGQEVAEELAQSAGLSRDDGELLELSAVPRAADGYVADLLMSSSGLVYQADAAGEADPLTGQFSDVRATNVVDDLGGGIVVQQLAGDVVYRKDRAEPETIDSSGALLLGVGFWDGSPRAFVLLGETQIDWIQLVSERGGDPFVRRNHINLAQGETVVDFAASRDLQAVIVQDEECGEIRFFNAEGEQLELRDPEPVECTFPGRPAYGSIALSPDGGGFIYTEVSYRADGTEAATELVSRELATGLDIAPRRRIGEDLDRISNLSFDGERAAFYQESREVASVTILDLRPSTVEVQVQLPSGSPVESVSFARIPIEAGA